MKCHFLKCLLLTSIFWGCINGMGIQAANAYPVRTNFPLISETTDSGQKPSNSTPNNELHYAQVFRNAHYGIESWRVISDQQIDHAINLVSQEGAGMMPYLLKLAQGDRTSNGWPYWALLCGSIARIGGSEGLPMLIEIANDEDAAGYVRYWAQNALSELAAASDE